MSTDLHIIYVVDDSKIIADIMKKVLSSIHGVTVYTFESGNEFLLKVEEIVPDIVFLDYYLDTENKNEPTGEVIFNQIKSAHPEIQVIMLTGINDPEKLNHFREIGFIDVINKNEPEIFNRITDCLQHLNI